MKITLTKKNTGKAMQIINNFFKQPTMIYNGKKMRKISDGHIDFEKDIYIAPKYEEFDEYIPQLNVSCHCHHMFKDKFFKDSPLLAISPMYGTSCIPIHEGDIIVYKGSQLIIKNLHDKKALKLRNISTNTFIHKNYSEKEKIDLIKLKLNDYIFDNIYNDDYFESMYEEDLNDIGYSIKELSKQIKNNLIDTLCNNEFQDKINIMNYGDFKINLIRNLNWFINNGFNNGQPEDIYKIEVTKDNEIVKISTSYIDIAEFIYNDIHKDDPVIEEDDDLSCYDEDFDYMY